MLHDYYKGVAFSMQPPLFYVQLKCCMRSNLGSDSLDCRERTRVAMGHFVLLPWPNGFRDLCSHAIRSDVHVAQNELSDHETEVCAKKSRVGDMMAQFFAIDVGGASKNRRSIRNLLHVTPFFDCKKISYPRFFGTNLQFLVQTTKLRPCRHSERSTPRCGDLRLGKRDRRGAVAMLAVGCTKSGGLLALFLAGCLVVLWRIDLQADNPGGTGISLDGIRKATRLYIPHMMRDGA